MTVGLAPSTIYHFRVVASSPDGTTDSADATFTTAPATPGPVPGAPVSPGPVPSALLLSALRVSPHAFSIAGRLVNGHCAKPTAKNHHLKPCRRAIKLHISYKLTTAASVTLTLARETPGRTVNGRCVTPTKDNRKHKRCTRPIPVSGEITQAGRAGANRLTFGTIGGHTLGRGAYRLTATPTGARSQQVTFRMVS